MRLLNKQILAKERVKYWEKLAAPKSDEGERNKSILDKIAISKAENPDPDEVVRLWGDDAIHTACEECETEMVPVVELGEACYEKNAATICRGCLEKALALISD